MLARRSRRGAIGLALLIAGAATSVWAADANQIASVVEPLEGGNLHRVVLTDRSAQRLGIKFGAVSHQKIIRSRTIEGMVMTAPYPRALLPFLAGMGDAPVTVVRAALASSVSSATVGQAVFVRPFGGTGEIGKQIAQLVTIVESESPDEPHDLFLVLTGEDHGLTALQPVLVEFSTTETARKTIPASALFYDEQGMAWVFTNPEPLVFIRHPMSVDFVQSDQAVLTDGPPEGTMIVTGGAMLLLGTEFGVGH